MGWVGQAHLSRSCLLFLPLSHDFISPPSSNTTPCFLQRPRCCPGHCSTLVPAHPQCCGHKAGDLRLRIDNLRFGRDGGPTRAGTRCQVASSCCDRGDVGSLFDGGCVVVALGVAARICTCCGSCPRGRRHLHDTRPHGHGRRRHVAL